MKGIHVFVRNVDLGGQHTDDHSLAGVDRHRVLEEAVNRTPELRRLVLRKQLRGVLEGTYPRRHPGESDARMFVAEDCDAVGRTIIRVSEVEVI